MQLWLKTFTLSDFLLAGYATPYQVITHGIEEAALSLSRIYRDVTAGINAQLELDKMPQMQLLWLMQYFFKHRYGYPFFENAIPNAVETIVLSSQDKDIKAFAVFFLSVAYKELGGKDNFDFLLSEELSPLPLPIDLALGLEAKGLKAKSKALKRYEKHLRDNLQRDPKTRKLIDDLFYKPITQPAASKRHRAIK